MSKMIKLSDEVGALLEERAKADGQTLAGEVNLLLRGNNLDKEYFDNKFREQQEAIREMRELIEDTTVDRVSGRPKYSSREKEYLDWGVARNIMYNICDDDNSPEWVSKTVYNLVNEWNDEVPIYVQDGFLWVQGPYSSDRILKVSPRVRAIIDNNDRGEFV